MLRFLLDTNALSEPARPTPDRRFMKHLEANREHVAISSVTWNEAVHGMSRLPPGRRRDGLKEYLFGLVLPSIPVLPYDVAAAEWHGAERARLSAAGTPPPFADGQIAAVARTRGLALVTENGHDFRHYDGLEVVSWKA